MIASPSQLAPLLAALGLTAQFNDNLKGFLGQLNYLQALNDVLYVYLEIILCLILQTVKLLYELFGSIWLE